MHEGAGGEVEEVGLGGGGDDEQIVGDEGRGQQAGFAGSDVFAEEEAGTGVVAAHAAGGGDVEEAVGDGGGAAERAGEAPLDGAGGEIDGDQLLTAGACVVDEIGDAIGAGDGAIHGVGAPVPAEVDGPQDGAGGAVVGAEFARDEGVEAVVAFEGGRPPVVLLERGVEKFLRAGVGMEAIEAAVGAAVDIDAGGVGGGGEVAFPLRGKGALPNFGAGAGVEGEELAVGGVVAALEVDLAVEPSGRIERMAGLELGAPNLGSGGGVEGDGVHVRGPVSLDGEEEATVGDDRGVDGGADGVAPELGKRGDAQSAEVVAGVGGRAAVGGPVRAEGTGDGHLDRRGGRDAEGVAHGVGEGVGAGNEVRVGGVAEGAVGIDDQGAARRGRGGGNGQDITVHVDVVGGRVEAAEGETGAQAVAVVHGARGVVHAIEVDGDGGGGGVENRVAHAEGEGGAGEAKVVRQGAIYHLALRMGDGRRSGEDGGAGSDAVLGLVESAESRQGGDDRAEGIAVGVGAVQRDDKRLVFGAGDRPRRGDGRRAAGAGDAVAGEHAGRAGDDEIAVGDAGDAARGERLPKSPGGEVPDPDAVGVGRDEGVVGDDGLVGGVFGAGGEGADDRAVRGAVGAHGGAVDDVNGVAGHGGGALEVGGGDAPGDRAGGEVDANQLRAGGGAADEIGPAVGDGDGGGAAGVGIGIGLDVHGPLGRAGRRVVGGENAADKGVNHTVGVGGRPTVLLGQALEEKLGAGRSGITINAAVGAAVHIDRGIGDGGGVIAFPLRGKGRAPAGGAGGGVERPEFGVGRSSALHVNGAVVVAGRIDRVGFLEVLAPLDGAGVEADGGEVGFVEVNDPLHEDATVGDGGLVQGAVKGQGPGGDEISGADAGRVVAGVGGVAAHHGPCAGGEVADGDMDAGGRGGAATIGHGVGELVGAADEIERGFVAEGAVRVGGDGAARALGEGGDGERVAVGVGVVAEDRDARDHVAGGGSGLVVAGERDVVHRGDVERHGGRGGLAASIPQVK